MYNASISRYPQVQVFLDMHVCKKVFLPDTFIEYVYIYIYIFIYICYAYKIRI